MKAAGYIIFDVVHGLDCGIKLRLRLFDVHEYASFFTTSVVNVALTIAVLRILKWSKYCCGDLKMLFWKYKSYRPNYLWKHFPRIKVTLITMSLFHGISIFFTFDLLHVHGYLKEFICIFVRLMYRKLLSMKFKQNTCTL